MALFDASFAEHPAYTKPRIASSQQFVVRHYAGDVTYTAAGFLSKNKDALYAELPALLRASSVPLLRALFDPKAALQAASREGGDAGHAITSMATDAKTPWTANWRVSGLRARGLHKAASVQWPGCATERCERGSS